MKGGLGRCQFRDDGLVLHKEDLRVFPLAAFEAGDARTGFTEDVTETDDIGVRGQGAE